MWRWWRDMPRIVFCRMCAVRYESVAGALPDHCPDCKQPALWTTEPVPKKPYDLNQNDRRFLRAIRIKADEN